MANIEFFFTLQHENLLKKVHKEKSKIKPKIDQTLLRNKKFDEFVYSEGFFSNLPYFWIRNNIYFSFLPNLFFDHIKNEIKLFGFSYSKNME